MLRGWRAGQAAAAHRPRRRLSPARPASRRAATGRARPRPARAGRGRRPVRAHSPVWLRRRRPNRGRVPPHRGGPTTAPRPRERTARGPGLPGIGQACWSVAVPARASARVAACAAAVRFPLRRATARRIIAAASRAAVWWSAGRRSRMFLGRVQPGDGRLQPAGRQRDRGADQVRPRFGPGFAVRDAGELIGRRRATRRLDDLADRQPVDDDVGGQLPVAGVGGVAHRVGEPAVALMPAGGLSVQGGHPGRRLAPQPATQYLREQRVVAIPPAPDRLDQRVGVRQRPQDAAGLVVAGQLGGGFGVDLLQDGGAQQQLADLGRLGVEHFLHQEAGQGAVLGQQVLENWSGSTNWSGSG